MGPTIPKEMKYNLHYGEVREDRYKIAIKKYYVSKMRLDFENVIPLLQFFLVS